LIGTNKVIKIEFEWLVQLVLLGIKLMFGLFDIENHYVIKSGSKLVDRSKN